MTNAWHKRSVAMICYNMLPSPRGYASIRKASLIPSAVAELYEIFFVPLKRWTLPPGRNVDTPLIARVKHSLGCLYAPLNGHFVRAF